MSNIEKRLGAIEKKLDAQYALNSKICRSNTLDSSNFESEIDLQQLFITLWNGKWIVGCSIVFFSLAAIAYALYLPNVYSSRVLLAPTEESRGGGLEALAGKAGGLASLAGISLSSGGADKVEVAIEVLRSRRFAENFVTKYDLLVPLFAVKGWSRADDILIIDPEIYDEKNQKWVRDVSLPKSVKPSMWEAYKKYKKVFSISHSKDSGFVTITVNHVSPIIAQEWASLIVKEINLVIRSSEVGEAKSSIEYLSLQLEKTPVADMRSVFHRLIEDQIKTIMLANVREEYVFKTLDPAVVAEDKSKPKRGMIVIIGGVLGGLVGALVLLLKGLLLGSKRSSA